MPCAEELFLYEQRGECRRLRAPLLLFAQLFRAVLVLAPSAGAQSSSQQTVAIQDFFFSPAQITVQPGTTVTWTNQGRAPHTVTADDGSFDSERLQPGQSFSHTFKNSGTVSYHCEVHPFMKGSVVVSPSSSAGSNAGGQTSSSAMVGGSMTSAKASSSASSTKPATLPSTGGISPLAIGGAGVGAIGTFLLIGGRLLLARR